jgi:hypothetical protein
MPAAPDRHRFVSRGMARLVGMSEAAAHILARNLLRTVAEPSCVQPVTEPEPFDWGIRDRLA